MALNLRAPQPGRYDIEPDHDPHDGLPLGAALSDWDREDASRNPGGTIDEAEPEAGAVRHWVRGGFGVLAVAGFVAVLWYAYEWGLGGGEAVDLPTVTAEAVPEKEKPSDPGGLQVPYQDQLVLNQSDADAAAPQVERLLPLPEAPLPALAEIAPSYDEPVEDLPLEGEVLQPAGEAVPTNVETVPQVPAAGAAEPEPAQPDAAPETVSAAEPAAAVPEPEPAAVEPTQTQSAAAQPAAPAPEAPAPEAPAPESLATPAAGKFAVQLVSLKDQGAAEAEWRRLQGTFPAVLGDASLLLQPAEVAGVGKVYRLRAGPYGTRQAAAQVCTQLKARQQDCFVVSR